MGGGRCGFWILRFGFVKNNNKFFSCVLWRTQDDTNTLECDDGEAGLFPLLGHSRGVEHLGDVGVFLGHWGHGGFGGGEKGSSGERKVLLSQGTGRGSLAASVDDAAGDDGECSEGWGDNGGRHI